MALAKILMKDDYGLDEDGCNKIYENWADSRPLYDNRAIRGILDYYLLKNFYLKHIFTKDCCSFTSISVSTGCIIGNFRRTS